MVKLVALYTHPENTEEFERRYFGEHLPLVRATPGLERLEVSRITGSPSGSLRPRTTSDHAEVGEAPYYLMAELYFKDRATMDAALASDESRQAARSLKFAAGLFTLLFAEEQL